jgi:hypothetical protein
MPDVISQINSDNRNIRKHRSNLLALADYSSELPDFADLFTVTGTAPDQVREPLDISTVGAKSPGFITVDGVGYTSEVSSEDTEMNQELEPVRSDITSIVKSLTVTYGEANSWTKGLYYFAPVVDWSTTKDGSYFFHDGQYSEPPFMRAYYLSQEGVGDATKYRLEVFSRIRLDGLGDRTMNRNDPETTQFTFKAFRDPVVGWTTAVLEFQRKGGTDPTTLIV